MTSAKLILATFKDASWLIVIAVVCLTTLAASSVLIKSSLSQLRVKARIGRTSA